MTAQALLELVAKQAAMAHKPLKLAAQHSRAIAETEKAAAVVSEAQRKGQLGSEKVRELAGELHRMAQIVEAGRARQAEAVAEVTVAVCTGRMRPGVRPRHSRGRPVRRRGSRRTAAATRAGPDDSSGDPEPGPSSGHVDRTLAGRRA